MCLIRENRDGTGEMYSQGKPIRGTLLDRPWIMEHVLWTFDEAGVNARDFDVYFINKSVANSPDHDSYNVGRAMRLALARGLSNLMPITRIRLKKAGLLTFDPHAAIEHHPGYLNQGQKRRRFSKRA